MSPMFNKRRDLLTEKAAAAGSDMLMICNPVNLLYFTGIKITPYERFIALILDTRSRQAQLVLPELERDAAKTPGSW